jgi:hypothetical protein
MQIKTKVKMKRLTYFFILILLTSCGMTGEKELNSKEMSLKWVDHLTGDFSFKDNLSYPENIYRNEFRQLVCYVFCPPEIDEMKDENGRIYEDSLEAYYKLVDTTHIFRSLESNLWTDEWAGKNIIVERINKDTVICFTEKGRAISHRLSLLITKDTVIPAIVANGPMKGTQIEYFKSGQMVIDEELWDKGILKATFDFNFGQKMDWRGSIYAKIENKGVDMREFVAYNSNTPLANDNDTSTKFLGVRILLIYIFFLIIWVVKVLICSVLNEYSQTRFEYKLFSVKRNFAKKEDFLLNLFWIFTGDDFEDKGEKEIKKMKFHNTVAYIGFIGLAATFILHISILAYERFT